MSRQEGRPEKLAEPVPLVIRNAPTRLMKELHYGKGYQYAHDAEEKLTNMQCLPDSLLGRTYYRPTEQGSEARVAQRLEQIQAWKRATSPPPKSPTKNLEISPGNSLFNICSKNFNIH